eukprot:m51a1_g5445 hypothetical protein (882) ;mRNA; r:194469-197411
MKLFRKSHGKDKDGQAQGGAEALLSPREATKGVEREATGSSSSTEATAARALQRLRDCAASSARNAAAAVAEGALDAVPAAMRAHAAELPVQLAALGALTSLLGEEACAPPAAVFEGVLAAMRAHAMSGEAQARACAVLRACVAASPREACARVAAMAGAYSVVGAMSAHCGSVDVQTQACAVLAALAADEGARESVAASGGLGTILAAVKAFWSNAALMDVACQAVAGVVCGTKDGVELFVRIGGIEMLANVAREYHTSSKIVGDCFAALSAVGTTSEVPRDLLTRANLVGVALDALREHPDNVRVAETSCALLRSLASTEGHAAISSGGGVELVVGAMKRFADSAAVQDSAMGALVYLVSSSAKNVAAVSRCAGVEATVAAMQAHRVSDGVQKRGCQLLSKYATVVGEEQHIQRCGGIKAVVDAMLQYPAHAEVQRSACTALHNLILNATENNAAVIEYGGLPAVCAALRTNPQVKEIQQLGCFIVRRLMTVSPEVVKAVFRDGGVEIAVSALRSHPTVAPVLVHACGILYTLAHLRSPKVTQTIARAGALEAMVASMNASPTNAELCSKACAAIKWIIAESPDNAAILVGCGGVDVISTALVMHQTTPIIQEYGGFIVRMCRGSSSSSASAPWTVHTPSPGSSTSSVFQGSFASIDLKSPEASRIAMQAAACPPGFVPVPMQQQQQPRFPSMPGAQPDAFHGGMQYIQGVMGPTATPFNQTGMNMGMGMGLGMGMGMGMGVGMPMGMGVGVDPAAPSLGMRQLVPRPAVAPVAPYAPTTSPPPPSGDLLHQAGFPQLYSTTPLSLNPDGTVSQTRTTSSAPCSELVASGMPQPTSLFSSMPLSLSQDVQQQPSEYQSSGLPQPTGLYSTMPPSVGGIQ